MDLKKQGSVLNLPPDGVVLRNLRRASYKLTVQSLDGRVTAMTSQDDHIFVAIAGKGIMVFSVRESRCDFYGQIGRPGNSCRGASPKQAAECQDFGVTCYDLSVSEKFIIYTKDCQGKLSVCVQDIPSILSGKDEILRQLEVSRRAPLVVDHQLEIIAIGCAAWTQSWTSDHDTNNTSDMNESHIRTLSLETLNPVREWKASENAVSLLRLQCTGDHNMLGVCDTVTGLGVYDLSQATDTAYVCLYHVPVEEIRNFHLVGNFVAVFHKFEPNVTFWNMKEQKTILCINIQDQMRELAEEFLEDDEDDCGLYGDDDDHVTSVTSVASDDDFVLLYGTKSGCVFGMSVNNRTKLFNVPCPHELPEPSAAPLRRDIRGLRYVPQGKLAVIYDNHGLTLLDFDLEDPPDRPPTRCQKRV